MKKKLFFLILTLVLVFGVFTVSSYATDILIAPAATTDIAAAPVSSRYTDVEDTWYTEPIERWSDYEVFEGRGDGTFAPMADMSRADAACLFVKLFNLKVEGSLAGFSDMQEAHWYDSYFAKCVEAGILTGNADGTMDPMGPITREQFFVMFARALNLEQVATAKVEFTDSAKISGWALGYVNALINKGYVTGMNDGTIQSTADINRASAVALLDKATALYITEDGTYTVPEGGIVFVNAAKVTLKSESAIKVVVTEDSAKVSLSGVKTASEVLVYADKAALTGAKDGTKVVAEKNSTGTAVNGSKLVADSEVIVSTPAPAPAPAPTPVCTEHTYEWTVVNGVAKKVCTNCGEEKELTVKAAFAVESEAKVTMNVYDDYSFVIEVPAANVDASNVTVFATLTDVAGLDIEGTRSHKLTVNTGITASPALNSYLSNVWEFDTATVNVKLGDDTFAYTITGAETNESNPLTAEKSAFIFGEASSLDGARAVWQALTAKVTVTTGEEDSKIYIASDSNLQNGDENLVLVSDLTIDNVASLSDLKQTIKDAVELRTASNTDIKATVGKGTFIQVGSTRATLDEQCNITVDTEFEKALDELREKANDPYTGKDLVKALVDLVNRVIGKVDGETLNVEITFGGDN